ncbi:DUF4348 domain-containing protein [Mucilaginibacter limnophilus]|uniref:DUF4348 domain-containing protein n=1 Tax=Mucilaginibacter limnophilus TaxID=1932778 RepID=UPI0013E2EF04|nr:DUF4348 domain-containing protein [Mucilaginibacter limnophilus]
MSGEPHLRESDLNRSIYLYSDPIAQVEKFDAFFKKFNANTSFQLARIMFPLKIVTVDDADKQYVKYINKPEWRLVNLLEIKDIIISKQNMGKGRITILLEIKDTGVHTAYTFENKNGKWYLFLVTDKST